MASKRALISFIENNYTDDDNLLWQVVSKEDIEPYLDEPMSNDKWDEFVDYTERYSVLADPFTENAVEQANDFEGEDND